LRWHGRLETEAATLTLAESKLALAAGERDALKILRGLLRRVKPTLLPRIKYTSRTQGAT
jgi:hypothetical protein